MTKVIVKENSPKARALANREAMLDLLRRAGNNDPTVAAEAQHEIAQAMTDHLAPILSPTFEDEIGEDGELISAAEQPLREGVLDGDIVSDIFPTEDFTQTSDMRLELDFLAPGEEKNHVAYTMPDHGYIPHAQVESSYIMLNTYSIASSIDILRKYLRNSRVDQVQRMLEVLQTSFTKKNNSDGWQTILAAANSRNIVTIDSDATAGQFTPKLVSLMKTIMRRNGGGNSSSINRKKLSDLYISPEAMEDMVSWGLNLVPESMRDQIYRSEDGNISALFGVDFHDLDELGVNQEFQKYWSTTLGASMGGSDEELVIGLDRTRPAKAFIRPIAERLMIVEDNMLHRRGLAGFYGTMEGGWAVLDTRYVLAGSF